MANTVAKNSVVTFHYTLRDDDGNVLDSSSGRDPMPYLHGHGNIVPGLEAQMSGKSVGDAFEAEVAPKDGYGEPSGQVLPIPRNQFPPDVDIQPGMMFGAQAPDGQPVQLTVVKVEPDAVHVSPDHPLAGKTLHFSIEIVEVRDGSAEEIAHGHPHGPGGAH